MTAMDGAALYLMENGYPNFLSLTYGVPKLSEIEKREASIEEICKLSKRLCKKYEKQKTRIKHAGEYIDQSNTIPISDKENLKRILHIKSK